jgi:sulfide:quinone oxidoreductase
VFYPALVRLAVGKSTIEDVSFDLRRSMLNRNIRFIEGEVARIDPRNRRIVLAHGEVQGEITYDYLVLALGRRLATERIKGFFEYAHHILSVDAAMKFGRAVQDFTRGRAVIGSCPDSRLPVPVYESAFALAERLNAKNLRDKCEINVIVCHGADSELGTELSQALKNALDSHDIKIISDFPVSSVSPGVVMTSDNRYLTNDLLMMVPPFTGPGPVTGVGITDSAGYIKVDRTMRVSDVDRMYAVGDCVNFSGPKMGHMAIRQAEVAAANLAAEIEGREPQELYEHEMMMVIDEGSGESIYFHKGLWDDEPGNLRQGRFWSWAKWVHERYWRQVHR